MASIPNRLPVGDEGLCKECGGFVDDTNMCVNDYSHDTGYFLCKECDGTCEIDYGEGPDACYKCDGLGLILNKVGLDEEM